MTWKEYIEGRKWYRGTKASENPKKRRAKTTFWLPDKKEARDYADPERFTDNWTFPPMVVLGTTLESNRCWNGSKAPCPVFRYQAMKSLPATMGYRKMVSIEPIMDFDLDEFVDMIRGIAPQFVSIGADSKNHNLPEPSADKVQRLIADLSAFTEVKLKDNLKRIGKIPQLGYTV